MTEFHGLSRYGEGRDWRKFNQEGLVTSQRVIFCEFRKAMHSQMRDIGDMARVFMCLRLGKHFFKT